MSYITSIQVLARNGHSLAFSFLHLDQIKTYFALQSTARTCFTSLSQMVADIFGRIPVWTFGIMIMTFSSSFQSCIFGFLGTCAPLSSNFLAPRLTDYLSHVTIVSIFPLSHRYLVRPCVCISCTRAPKGSHLWEPFFGVTSSVA